MKKNKLTLLILGLLVLIAGVIYSNKSFTSLDIKSSSFAERDTANIVKMFMADKKNNQILLHREASGVWSMDNGHTANQALINSLLSTMRNLRVLKPVAKSASDVVLRNMSSSSIKVEVYTQSHRIDFAGLQIFPYEKLSKTFYVGSPTMDSHGTFMLMEGSDSPCITYIPSFRGYLSTRFNVDKNIWREYTLFKENANTLSQISISSSVSPEYNYTINYAGGYDFISSDKHYDASLVDTIKLYNYAVAFRDVRFEAMLKDRLKPAFIDSVCQSVPVYEINVTRKDGKNRNVKFFEKNHIPDQEWKEDHLTPYDFERMYALIEQEGEFVLVQQFSLESIFRPADYFIKK